MRGRNLVQGLTALLVLSAGSSPQAHAEATPLAKEYALAEQSFRAGDLAHAEQLYSRILESHGDEPMAWFRVGLIEQKRHSFRAALNAYDKALACAPANSSDEIGQVLAKVRFNRALLLLDSAANDLKDIAPGVLEDDLDSTRRELTTHVTAALSAAGAPMAVTEPPPSLRASTAPASGYVYEVKTPVVTITTVEDSHP